MNAQPQRPSDPGPAPPRAAVLAAQRLALAAAHRGRGRGGSAVKAWIVQHFALFERVHVLRVLDIILTYNTGAAFSFLAQASGWQRWLFVLLALGVSAALIVWLRRLHAGRPGAARLRPGADRRRRTGQHDRPAAPSAAWWISSHVHWQQHYFPAFNVADSAITIGAALLLLDAWRESRAHARERA